jgi:hypothetical protein
LHYVITCAYQVQTVDLTPEITTDVFTLARGWVMTVLEDFTNEFIEINNFKLLEDPTSLDVLLQRFTTEIVHPNDIFDVANGANDDLRDPRILTIHTKIVFDVILAALTNGDSDPEIFRIYHEAVRDQFSLDSLAHPAPRLRHASVRKARVSLPMPRDAQALSAARIVW